MNRFILTLRPAAGNWQTPPIVRLRALLKRLKRTHGFECVYIRETPPDAAIQGSRNDGVSQRPNIPPGEPKRVLGQMVKKC
jgi:hypothetical protein